MLSPDTPPTPFAHPLRALPSPCRRRRPLRATGLPSPDLRVPSRAPRDQAVRDVATPCDPTRPHATRAASTTSGHPPAPCAWGTPLSTSPHGSHSSTSTHRSPLGELQPSLERRCASCAVHWARQRLLDPAPSHTSPPSSILNK